MGTNADCPSNRAGFTSAAYRRADEVTRLRIGISLAAMLNLDHPRYPHMAFSDELFFAPATQLLQMLRSRQISSAEMVSAFVERIESLNHHVKSVVTLVEERAAEESDEAD